MSLASYLRDFSRNHFGTQKRQHLIYLVETKGRFPLFKFAHKTKPHPGFLGKVNLRKPELLAHLLNVFS